MVVYFIRYIKSKPYKWTNHLTTLANIVFVFWNVHPFTGRDNELTSIGIDFHWLIWSKFRYHLSLVTWVLSPISIFFQKTDSISAIREALILCGNCSLCSTKFKPSFKMPDKIIPVPPIWWARRRFNFCQFWVTLPPTRPENLSLFRAQQNSAPNDQQFSKTVSKTTTNFNPEWKTPLKSVRISPLKTKGPRNCSKVNQSIYLI